MCYTVSIDHKVAKVAQRLNIAIDTNTEKFIPIAKVSGFAHPNLLIIKQDNPKLLTCAQWGLFPEWAKDPSIQNLTLNAKIETLKEKPSFAPYIRNRCIVIVDGFYEWQWHNKSGSKKQEYKITMPEQEIFSLAGIWCIKAGITTFSILTQPANTLMASIHNTKKRMPLIIEAHHTLEWLNTGKFSMANDNLPLIATPQNQIQGQLFDF